MSNVVYEKSQLQQLKEQPPEVQQAFLNSLTDEQAYVLMYDLDFILRPKQMLQINDWETLMFSAGRGFGKTRAATAGVQKLLEWGYKQIGLVAANANEIRTTLVDNNPSSIFKTFPPHLIPQYNPSNKLLYWPQYDAYAYTISAEEPESLRRMNLDAVVIDELAKFRYQEQVMEQ